MSRRRFGALIVVLALLAIARLTLAPQASGAGRAGVPWWCLLCADLAALGALLNVVLFVPLGLGLRLTGMPTRLAGLAGACTSLLVELLQYRVLQGRDASLDDLVANTLGALLGALAVSVTPHAMRTLRARPLPIVAASITAWSLLLVTTGELSKPSTPAGDVRVRLEPEEDGAPFGGRVLDVRLDGRALRPGGAVAARPGVARARRLETRIVAGARPAGRTTIAAAVDGPGREFLSLAREEDDLLVRVRLRSSDAGLLSPHLRFRDAFSGDANDTMVVSARYSFDGLDATSCGGGSCRSSRLERTPGWGWRFFLPVGDSIDRWPALSNAIWLLLLALPTGALAAWIGVARGRALALGVLAIGLVGSLALAPLRRVGRVAPPAEWLSVLGGIGAGCLVGRTVRRRLAHRSGSAAPARETGDAGVARVHPSH